MFVGRNEELRELREKYATDRFEFAMVYGKRRIGKSQLILESLKGFGGIVVSYECFKTSYESNLRNLESEIKKAFRNEYLRFESLYELILFLHEGAKGSKVILVIDEYPYLRESDSVDAEIKNAVDRINELDESNPLKIVLCGSAIDVMEVLDDENKPLFGRFTCKIKLPPLNYLESSHFYPNASLEDKVDYYCVLGGVPYYLKQIDEKKSFDDNIVRLFFSSNALLRTELESSINNEISKIEKGPFILDIIKDRVVAYSDIEAAFRRAYPGKTIAYALAKLLEIGAAEKVIVKQDNGANKPYYRIKENSLVFYYSYLNRSFGNPLLFSSEDYYRTFIVKDLKERFIPHAFEKVAFEFIAMMNRKRMLPDFLSDLYPLTVNDRMSKRSYQFDIVGETVGGLINYECKYRNSPIGASAYSAEKRQAELSRQKFIKTVFISKTAVGGEGVERYLLKDLFSAELDG